MELFYFDMVLRSCEERFEWDHALEHLQTVYRKSKGSNISLILNSLIGFSWYYLIEGPIVSKKYEKDENTTALDVWRKYTDIGLSAAQPDSALFFVAGYTLSLHGYYLGEEYEKKGHLCIEQCMNHCRNAMIRQLARCFFENENTLNYVPLKNGGEICAELFSGTSLLDRYFTSIYSETRNGSPPRKGAVSML
jgi:hypothetical protein